jgi:hypothetical protein
MHVVLSVAAAACASGVSRITLITLIRASRVSFQPGGAPAGVAEHERVRLVAVDDLKRAGVFSLFFYQTREKTRENTLAKTWHDIIYMQIITY